MVTESRGIPAGTVTGEITFMVPAEQRPYVHTEAFTGEPEPRYYAELQRRAVTIHDARTQAQELSLDRHGIELHRRPTIVDDLYDDAHVEQDYYQEIEALVREATGASQVVIFDHTRRRDDGGSSGSGTKPPADLPVKVVAWVASPLEPTACHPLCNRLPGFLRLILLNVVKPCLDDHGFQVRQLFSIPLHGRRRNQQARVWGSNASGVVTFRRPARQFGSETQNGDCRWRCEMKAALLVMFSLIWSGSVLASGTESAPGYVNYDYPSSDAGEPFNILRTGTMVKPGIYEPGYVNYRYSPSNHGPKAAQTGKWLASGVFEPTYLNYCVGSM